MCIFLAVFGAAKVLWTTQEKDIMVLPRGRFVALCLLFVFNIFYALGTLTLAFLHVKYLTNVKKHGTPRNIRASSDSIFSNGYKDKLKIRTIPASRIKGNAVQDFLILLANLVA